MTRMVFGIGIVSRSSTSQVGIKTQTDGIASKVPGAPFAEYLYTGSLGRFLGFLACLIQASATIGGQLAIKDRFS